MQLFTSIYIVLFSVFRKIFPCVCATTDTQSANHLTGMLFRMVKMVGKQVSTPLKQSAKTGRAMRDQLSSVAS